jgi:nicotinate-nucleotide adenylyltransferase
MPAAPDPDDRAPRRRIALFGGTFDPVHLGHLHLAELAKNQLALDEVRFLPCRISPHKTGIAPAPPEHRLEMLRLATAGLPWAVVDDFELQHPGPSFSYQTAEAISAREPSARLFWIMGGDQWDALPRWSHPERLAAAVEFIVLDRGQPSLPRPGFRMCRIPGAHPASATAIRRAVADGVDPQSLPWLPRPAATYLQAHGLYAAPGTS